MQKKVVDWLYNLQSRWGILKEEERSLYEYAYRLLLSRILIYSIIIALGIITGNWLEMFSFLLPFVILRQYVGGIHLKRSVSCICVSGFLIFICGKYLAINSELTLGALSTAGGQLLSGPKRHPTLLNNVTVYAGATILGGETVIEEGRTVKGNDFIYTGKQRKTNGTK